MKKKTEPIEKIEEAFTLYCQGSPLIYIAKVMRLGRHVIERWEKKFEWENRRSRIVSDIQGDRDNAIMEMIDDQIKDICEIDKKLESFMQNKEPESFSVALRGRLKIMEICNDIFRLYDYKKALEHIAIQYTIDKFLKYPLFAKAMKDNNVAEHDVRTWLHERFVSYYAEQELKKQYDEAKKEHKI